MTKLMSCYISLVFFLCKKRFFDLETDSPSDTFGGFFSIRINSV